MNSRGRVPLRSDARVREIAKQVHKRVPVTWKRCDIFRNARLEFLGVLGKLRMRETGETMMNAVIGLVQKSEGNELADQPIGNNATRGAIDRGPGHADVLERPRPERFVMRRSVPSQD